MSSAGKQTSKMVVAQNDGASCIDKTKDQRTSVYLLSVKSTEKTTKILSRLTEADERGYLLSYEVLLRLKLGQRLGQ